MIKIRRVNKEIPLPEYKTKGSVGLDLYPRENVIIPAKQMVPVPMNINISMPEDCMILMAPRSSLFKKKKLILVNSVGIFDQDFVGNSDEYIAQFYNMGDEDIEIKTNERLAQLIFVKIAKPELVEVEDMESDSRGGIGSTSGYEWLYDKAVIYEWFLLKRMWSNSRRYVRW